jgi:phosphatidylglycerophosphatase A
MIKKTEILLSHPAHFMALGFGSGLAVIAPGTVGTLWAWASYVLMDYCLGTAQIAGVILASLLMGWWACTVTADHMGVSDPSAIVWDEIVAFWIVLFVVMPAGVGDQLAAFVLFRFFDIAKPGPIGLCDRLFKGRGYKGGFGIMVDDLAAAFFTLLVLALWQATHLS